jgi:hypothetical protein
MGLDDVVILRRRGKTCKNDWPSFGRVCSTPSEEDEGRSHADRGKLW